MISARRQWFLPLSIEPQALIADYARRYQLDIQADHDHPWPQRRGGKRAQRWEVVVHGPAEGIERFFQGLEDYFEARGCFNY